MKYLLMIVLLFSFNQAKGEAFLTGSVLLERCEAYLNKTGLVKGSTCWGYILGVSDTYSHLAEWGEIKPYWCEPDGVGSTQLIRIVIKQLQEHPESLHKTASSLVANALYTTFPCE